MNLPGPSGLKGGTPAREASPSVRRRIGVRRYGRTPPRFRFTTPAFMSTVRRIRTLSALAIAVGLLAPSARAHAQEGLKVGTMAPTSAPLETLDGQIVNVSAYVGKRPDRKSVV